MTISGNRKKRKHDAQDKTVIKKDCISETKKAGLKQFVFVLIWAIIIGTVISYIRFILPVYKVAADIATIAGYAVLGFFTLTRYSAVYTYYADKNILRINRTIGKRNKEAEFSMKEIKTVSKTPPGCKCAHFGIKVLDRRGRVYITGGKNGSKSVSADMSPEFYKKLRRLAGIDK